MVLSHDIDTRRGYEKVLRLVELEEQMGFRSQFNFVPERYGEVEISLIEELKSRGFGIGVHGLKHDGKLFGSKDAFDKSAVKIDCYLKEWGTKGFTAPSMIRNHDWMQQLDLEYCISTFDTDPFEPQSEGAGTIFPFWVQNDPSKIGFLELPYTLPQDHLLFVILQEKTINIWKRKLDWVASRRGMALSNTHSDYMNFGDCPLDREEYPIEFYESYLNYVSDRYKGRFYHALPSGVASYCFSALTRIPRAIEAIAVCKKVKGAAGCKE